MQECAAGCGTLVRPGVRLCDRCGEEIEALRRMSRAKREASEARKLHAELRRREWAERAGRLMRRARTALAMARNLFVLATVGYLAWTFARMFLSWMLNGSF